jgi:hypothetical protein
MQKVHAMLGAVGDGGSNMPSEDWNWCGVGTTRVRSDSGEVKPELATLRFAYSSEGFVALRPVHSKQDAHIPG